MKIKVGDLVHYHSVIGGPVTSSDHEVYKIQPSWAKGEEVAWISGHSGCVATAALSMQEKLVHITVQLDCKIIDGRLYPCDGSWEHDYPGREHPDFCIHCVKHRWTCEECDEIVEGLKRAHEKPVLTKDMLWNAWMQLCEEASGPMELDIQRECREEFEQFLEERIGPPDED